LQDWFTRSETIASNEVDELAVRLVELHANPLPTLIAPPSPKKAGRRGGGGL
jgi:hypothetical protein